MVMSSSMPNLEIAKFTGNLDIGDDAVGCGIPCVPSLRDIRMSVSNESLVK